MQTGWRKISGKWYYMGSANDGAMKTGWQKISGNWYYLGGTNDGTMKAGWQKISGNWYYFGSTEDGSMKTGLQEINGEWYYLGGAEGGSMKTGWLEIDDEWYYFETSGSRQSDEGLSVPEGFAVRELSDNHAIFQLQYNGYWTTDKIVYDRKTEEYLVYRTNIDVNTLENINFDLVKKNAESFAEHHDAAEYTEYVDYITLVDSAPTVVRVAIIRDGDKIIYDCFDLQTDQMIDVPGDIFTEI
ncbi:hypothetical protein ABXS75_02445 [Roseburia hominis]